MIKPSGHLQNSPSISRLPCSMWLGLRFNGVDKGWGLDNWTIISVDVYSVFCWMEGRDYDSDCAKR